MVQREGGVIHVIAERIEDYTPLLRSVGEMDFPHRPGPGDGVTHPGSPDRGSAAGSPRCAIIIMPRSAPEASRKS
jgi:error-prone DNA polymerase